MAWDLGNCTVDSESEVRCNIDGVIRVYSVPEECAEHQAEAGSSDFWGFLIAAFICICFAGAMSGLTVGLMSFDEKGLSVLMTQSKDEMERFHAKRVLSLIKNHHMLLVTLLFWNAAAFESLPIFLDRLVPSWAAILISVTLILIFGEIVPQAACTGPRKLIIGSKSYWLVWTLIVVTYPIAYVFAKALDYAVGHGGAGGSKFMYLPRSALGLEQDPNAMALVELHGVEEEIQPASPVSRRSSKSPLEAVDTEDELPPVVVDGPATARGDGKDERDTAKFVLAEDGEIEGDDSSA